MRFGDRRIHIHMQTFPLVEGKMRLLRKRADGYEDAGRLHAGRVVYCSNQENADDHRSPSWAARHDAGHSAAIGRSRIRFGIQSASTLMTRTSVPS